MSFNIVRFEVDSKGWNAGNIDYLQTCLLEVHDNATILEIDIWSLELRVMSRFRSPWNNIAMLMNSNQLISSLLLKEHTELRNQHQNFEAYGWLRELTEMCPKKYSFLSFLTVHHKSRGTDNFSNARTNPQQPISTCKPKRYNNGSEISLFAQFWGWRLYC